MSSTVLVESLLIMAVILNQIAFLNILFKKDDLK